MDNQEYRLFGNPIERLEKPFCERCLELLRDKKYHLCYTCYKEKDKLYFGKIRTVGIYRPRKKDGNYLGKVIRHFKYDSISESERERIAEEFAALLHQYVSHEREIITGVDCLVFVPVTKKG